MAKQITSDLFKKMLLGLGAEQGGGGGGYPSDINSYGLASFFAKHQPQPWEVSDELLPQNQGRPVQATNAEAPSTQEGFNPLYSTGISSPFYWEDQNNTGYFDESDEDLYKRWLEGL